MERLKSAGWPGGPVDGYDRPMAALAVRDNQDDGRFEITSDGDLGLCGISSAPRADRVRAHRGPALRGRDSARGWYDALEEARPGSGRAPLRPFVNAYLQRHPEYADLVPPEHRERFGL